ncbi:unnamed protein product [Medioppia subpectinata]|uniref:Uncharacterized protein n=1 Tax=Medioppia subpectinata TaxID=1979941 RepID=A0A7R9KF24_9ACAR|nr:unnamed protein product [Medioppia subpectinata]CAG2102356.1 unnamed protein product [Medioppia subpectinata]
MKKLIQINMISTIKSYLRFICLLRVEPLMLLFTTCYFLKRNPQDVLFQDKLCRNKYNMSEEFCLHLSDNHPNDTDSGLRTEILSDAVMYNAYNQWMTLPVSIVWSLFLGAWIDRYPKGRKWVFIIGTITQAMEAAINGLNSYFFASLNVNWILISYVPYILSGASTWTTIYSYVGITTPAKYRTTRMTIIEVMFAFAQPLGVYLGGLLINRAPVGGNGQLHNTGLIFLVSCIGNIVAFLWVLLFINQQKDSENFEKYFGDDNTVTKNVNEFNDLNTNIDTNTDNETKTIVDNNKAIHPLRLLLDWRNVKDIVMSCFKSRSHFVRAQLMLIIMADFCGYFIKSGILTFAFQFAEKIYNWDSKVFSEYQSMSLIITSISVLLLTSVLIRIFKCNDMCLAIIGFLSILLQNLILGVILKPTGYYISMGVNCMSSLGNIGYKTHLSKIITPLELGKVFTLVSVVDAIAPIIAAPLFAFVFKNTIDTLPGTCFLILAGVASIPILIALTIDYINRYKITVIIKTHTECVENGIINSSVGNNNECNTGIKR